jgi:tetratricopeptide (TPR) repeat protein
LQAYHNNDFEKAHEWIEQALHIDERSTLARNVLGILQMARGEHQAARETFLQLLEADPEKQLGTRYILLNNVAYLDALMRDPALMPEADQYSTEALKHLPWVSAVVGTRGTVLVEMGQLEEGIALLKKSMSLHPDRQGKALNACHLAIAEFRRGHLEQAHKYMATARTLDPRCILLHEVERELDTPLTSRELPLSHQSA